MGFRVGAGDVGGGFGDEGARSPLWMCLGCILLSPRGKGLLPLNPSHPPHPPPSSTSLPRAARKMLWLRRGGRDRRSACGGRPSPGRSPWGIWGRGRRRSGGRGGTGGWQRARPGGAGEGGVASEALRPFLCGGSCADTLPSPAPSEATGQQVKLGGRAGNGRPGGAEARSP